MTLTIADFPKFFADLHQARQPFVWQERLLADVAERGRWPDRIIAPTGAGKTAVLDVHVFAVALMAAGTGPRVPRRLSLVVDRRALVDSQHDLARSMNDTLRRAVAAGDGVLAEAGRALLSLHTSGGVGQDPVVVALLRGGAPAGRRWVDDPAAPAIICATPDMWGSRLLFRGYGSSRLARPREAGLLAYDSVVVVDEAHLARQLVATARRIDALESMATTLPRAPRIQVVEATATPGGDPTAHSVGVSELDLDLASPAGAVLARRLRTPKPLRLVPSPDWPGGSASAKRGLARTMADETVDLRERHGATIACVTNRVGTALLVAADLRGRGLTVELLVGRLRPHDLWRLRERRPCLLTTDGDPDVDVVVATQTIEVGIDADFAAMVTELAAGTAIAQRAGRVNRIGRREVAEIRIVVPDAGVPAKGTEPYSAGDSADALAWLKERSSAPDGLAPWAVSSSPPPGARLPRLVLGRPEPWDAALLARTSDDLNEDPDLDLWLSDDLEPDTDVSVVVRAGLPSDEIDAVTLIRATPPQAAECFPVSVSTLRAILTATPGQRRFVWRGDDVAPPDDAGSLRPGDIVIADTGVSWFASGVVEADGTEPASDVLEDALDAGSALVRIGSGTPLDVATGGRAGRDLLPELLSTRGSFETESRACHVAMAAVIDEFRVSHVLTDDPLDRRLAALTRLLNGRLADVEVTTGRPVDGEPPAWLVISDVRRNLGDEAARQTWSVSGGTVSLDDHQRAVSQRAQEISVRLALGGEVTLALAQAGVLHDEGKRDRRFQLMLHAPADASGLVAGTETLAKSGMRVPAQFRAAQAASGLPTGWRHEQVSAVAAAGRLDGAGDVAANLVIRLVGTSHGHGRPDFPHTTPALFDGPSDLLERSSSLHDDGGWDALFEATHRAHGVWGCAYLESILRAADVQVSREGG